LFKVDEVILAHGQTPTNRVDLILLHVASLSETEPHLRKGDDIFALYFIYTFALALLLNQTHDLLDLVLAEPRKGLLLLELQRLDELHLLAEQQDDQADDLLIDALFDGDAAVPLQPYSGDVLQWLDGGRVDEVEETHEVHPLLVPIEPEEYLHLVLRLGNAVFLEHLEDVSAGDESLSPGDVVEEREGVEV
jgi:hypothetical protein